MAALKNGETINSKKEKTIDKVKIIETVNRLFIGIDELNWEQVHSFFNDSVYFDYTSLGWKEPVTLSPEQITGAWNQSLPGFDAVHHQLGNHTVDIGTESAKVFCYGTVSFFLKNDSNKNTSVTVGTYDLELKKDENGRWRVTKIKFNLKYRDGNSDLSMMAYNRVKNGEVQ